MCIGLPIHPNSDQGTAYLVFYMVPNRSFEHFPMLGTFPFWVSLPPGRSWPFIPQPLYSWCTTDALGPAPLLTAKNPGGHGHYSDTILYSGQAPRKEMSQSCLCLPGSHKERRQPQKQVPLIGTEENSTMRGGVRCSGSINYGDLQGGAPSYSFISYPILWQWSVL
jgi:hypothetical protein